MKTAGYALLSGVIAISFAALLNHAVTVWLPCHGEGLACSMDGLVGLLTTLAIGGIATIVLGIVVFVRPSIKTLNLAGIVLLLPVLGLFIITLSEISLLRDGAPWYWREYQKLLQIPVPAALAVIAQWLALTFFVRGRSTVAA